MAYRAGNLRAGDKKMKGIKMNFLSRRGMVFGWGRGFFAGLMIVVASCAHAQSSGVLSRIASGSDLFLGHRESAIPFSYVGGAGQSYEVFGYSWEICSHVADTLERRVGREIKVVPVAVTANTRFLMIKTGMTSIECGASTNNVARQKLVSFSNTIYVAEVRIMVRQQSGIKQLSDLSGRRVVSVVGTTADRLLKGAALARNMAIDHVFAASHGEALQMMLRGEAVAYVGDDAILAATRASIDQNEDLVFLDDVLATEPYGLVLPKGDEEFKALVDDVIVSLIQSGELQKIYDRWFMSPIPPKGINLRMPMSDRMKAILANPNDTPVN